jgi:sigma-B regulation protein RsbU (phosphoserine phosphatase)
MGEPGVVGLRARGVPAPLLQARRVNARWRARELATRLSALQRECGQLHEALFEATQVHRQLCAPRLVRSGAFEIASEIFAVRYLPGDFFTIEDADGRLVLALGDVCGKGLSAGMWTTCMVGLVRAHAALDSEPAAIVTGINREFCRMEGPLTSLFVARLDPVRGDLEYCSAGHPPALVLRANGRCEWLSTGGMLAGFRGDASFATGRVRLEDDVLVVYSDGVIEARNDAEQEFGEHGLEAHLRRSDAAAADAVLFSLLAAVQDFAAPRALMDDTSLVVVRRAGGLHGE